MYIMVLPSHGRVFIIMKNKHTSSTPTSSTKFKRGVAGFTVLLFLSAAIYVIDKTSKQKAHTQATQSIPIGTGTFSVSLGEIMPGDGESAESKQVKGGTSK